MAKAKDERYYDELLLNHERRCAKGLPPSEEYKRLSDLGDVHLEAVESLLKSSRGRDGVIPVPKELSDFLEAIDRRTKRGANCRAN